MVEPGQVEADAALQAVGVVDANNLGRHAQRERNIKTVPPEQNL